ncbi:MAG: hypothetical protein M3P96_11500 [Actinomycetota bacterium]|nr:hypothetical protein [Actinomycetota bacterium]
MRPDVAASLLAHGLGGRQDLPIPFSYALVGSAATLVVSFLALGLLVPEPRLRGERAGRLLPEGLQRVANLPALRRMWRVVGLTLAGYVTLAAVLGPDLATNPTAGVVYVLFWVGLVPASLLLGNVWRALNPLRTLHAGLAALLRVPPERGLRPLPRRLGYWPAVVGILAFVWLELVAPERTTLPVLRTWLAGYVGVTLIAAAFYGSRWFDRGDAFEVYSGLLGRFAPVGRRDDGRLVLRSPLDGLAGLRAAPGLVAVICVLLGSTAYDGMSNAPFWVRLQQTSALPPVVTGTLGLVGVTGLVLAAYVGATRAAAAGGQGPPARELPGAFAHALAPIALGYLVAHYYSLFVLEGQRTISYLSDPLGTGADWLGMAERRVDSSLVTPSGVATLQVAAVLAGHVLGVVLAHDRAMRLFPRRHALAGQLPLLAVMVAYTLAGLLLLFAG